MNTLLRFSTSIELTVLIGKPPKRTGRSAIKDLNWKINKCQDIINYINSIMPYRFMYLLIGGICCATNSEFDCVPLYPS